MPKKFKFNPRKRIAKDGTKAILANGRKATYAMACIGLHLKLNQGGDYEEYAVTDLIADLLHLCDRDGFDADVVLDQAINHWEEER